MESEEERQIKLQEKVDVWWYGLDDNFKFELIENYYPGKAHLMGLDEMWNGLDWNDRWDIYTDEKDEVYE